MEKRLHWILVLTLPLAALGQNHASLMTDTNGNLIAPTNFFAQNSNLLNQAIGGGGGGGSQTPWGSTIVGAGQLLTNAGLTGILGITNQSDYLQTNAATGAYLRLGTNGHFTWEDELGTVYKTSTNGVFSIVQTNGHSLLYTNGALSISGTFTGSGAGLTGIPNQVGLDWLMPSGSVTSGVQYFASDGIDPPWMTRNGTNWTNLTAGNLVGTIPSGSLGNAVITNSGSANSIDSLLSATAPLVDTQTGPSNVLSLQAALVTLNTNNGGSLTNLSAGNINGTLPAANLGSGGASAGTALMGNQTWQQMTNLTTGTANLSIASGVLSDSLWATALTKPVWTNIVEAQDFNPATNLNKWKPQGSASWGVTNGMMMVGGSGNAYNDYLLCTNFYTACQDFTWSFDLYVFTKGGSVGFGVAASAANSAGNTNDMLWYLNTLGGGSDGQFALFYQNSPIGGATGTAYDRLSYLTNSLSTPTNGIHVVYTQRDSDYSITCSNFNNPVVYRMDYARSLDVVTNGISVWGSIAFWSSGSASYGISNLTYGINTTVPCPGVAIGDSTTEGFGCSSYEGPWVNRMRSALLQPGWVKEATGGTRTGDSLYWTNEINLINARVNVYQIGVNDAALGSNVWGPNYSAFYAAISNRVFMVTPYPYSGIDMSTNYFFITQNFPATNVIDLYHPFLNSGLGSAAAARLELYYTPLDGNEGPSGLHPNDVGHSLAYQIINARVNGNTQ